MEFKPFRIEDKARIDSYFAVHHYEQIDCTFNTLFLWQDAYQRSWAEQDGILFVRAGTGKDTFFMPPFAKEEENFVHGLALIHEEYDKLGLPFRLKSASSWVTEQIERLVPGKYDFIEDRDNEEYIYRTEDMIRLPGKKLRMKKNHLNGFLRQYADYQYEAITKENLEDAKAGIHDWFLRHGDIEEEEQAIKRCFDNWDALGVKGAVIRIYGKVEAHRIADGDSGFSDDNLVAVAKGRDGEIAGVDLHDGKVGDGVGADDFAFEAAAVREGDDDFFRPFDDVVVRDDVAVGAEDDAGADALGLDRVVEPVTRDGLVRDADDSRADSFRGADGRRVAGIRKITRVRRPLRDGHDAGCRRAGGSGARGGTAPPDIRRAAGERHRGKGKGDGGRKGAVVLVVEKSHGCQVLSKGVKELVFAGMFYAARDIVGGIDWCLDNQNDENIAKTAEKQKKNFAGTEISGKKLGVIGLGAIGVLVANAATHMGMEVYGYDPYISVNAAWNLSRSVKHISNVEDIYKECDFITIHVPLLDSTKKMIDAKAISMMKPTAIVLNFARDLLVDEEAMVDALAAGRIKKYVSDFPNTTTVGAKGCIVTPHLGASTAESEDNCAIMAVREIRDYLENGNITHSVNYPDCNMGACLTAGRIGILHKNVKGMIAQYTTILGEADINVSDMTNKAKGDYAYALLDLDSPVTDEVVAKLRAIEGVLRVRVVK